MAVAASIGLSAPAFSADYTWGFNAPGNWTDSSGSAGWNALGAYPNAIGDSANLTFDISAATQITLDVNAIVGSLSLNDTGGGTDSAWSIIGANSLTFDVSSGNAALTSAGATNSILTALVLNDTLDLTTTSNLNIGDATTAANISGAGGLNKLGAGTLTLSGTSANTYSGLTSVAAGTLALAKTGTNAIAGDLTINGGTVSMTNGNQIADTAKVTINTGGSWTFGGGQSETIANLDLAGGLLSFAQNASGNFTVSGATVVSSGTVSAVTGNSKTLSFGALTMSGGVINHSQFNTSGSLLIDAASLTINNTASGAYTPISLQARSSVSSVLGSLRLSGNLTFVGNATNANSAVIDSTPAAGAAVATLQLLAGSGTFNIGDGLAEHDLIVKPRITGAGNLIKTGAGTLVLNGPNTYGGNTKVVAGALVLGSDAASTVTANATYSANDVTDVFSAAGTSFSNGDVVVLSGANTPAGASQNTPYYVVNVSGNTFQLSLTAGGTPINITNTGAGSGKLLTQAGALGAANTTVDLGDLALTTPSDNIALISNGAYVNKRNITVVNAGNSTTIGASNAAATTASYTGGITLNKSVILHSKNAGAVTRFSGLIDDGAGSSGVTISGAGIVDLNQAGGNTYDGGTTVLAGSTLLVNNTAGSATGTGAVTVAAGGTLGGSGIISGNTTISGFHNPGNSPGIQTFGANLSYNSGAAVNFELAANTTTQGSPIAVFDQIVVGGDLDFSGPTTLSLTFNGAGSSVDWSNSLWDTNQSWLLYDVAGVTTNFGNFSLASFNWLDAQGDAFNTVRAGSSFSLSQIGSDVYINYSTIPEPGATALVGIGLASLLFFRRRTA